MYGMVNQAIKSMVLERFDEATWEEICKRSDLKLRNFAPFEQYDDEITGKLISAIVDLAQIKPTDLLEAFGEYWIINAKNSEYSSILESFATSPVELVDSLDHLHSRLRMIFPNLSPPSFWVEKVNEKEVLVNYNSSRTLPLEYFVIGLLKGIFKMFNHGCQITMLPAPEGQKGLFKVTF
jgi:hypothetical protein